MLKRLAVRGCGQLRPVIVDRALQPQVSSISRAFCNNTDSVSSISQEIERQKQEVKKETSRDTTLVSGVAGKDGQIKGEQVSSGFSSPPLAPGAEECCGTGCSDCIFLKYAEELVDYYKDGGEAALQEIVKIEDPSVRMFVRTEIQFYLSLDEAMRKRVRASHKEAKDTTTTETTSTTTTFEPHK